jgi:anti-anti-sigma factor
MIQTTEETRKGWRIVTVSGRADHEAADALESALKSAVEGNARVAADFSALLYISSAGLRSVVQAARAAQARGSEFAICGISEMVRKVFDASGLDQFLHIHRELPC